MREFTFYFFILLSIFESIICSNVLKPRGVSLSKASFYVPGAAFTCFDGSYTIPFVYVNDDYCDCQDGSDEPGTSACPNGTFYCSNAGHSSLIIPSSRVNDGICGGPVYYESCAMSESIFNWLSDLCCQESPQRQMQMAEDCCDGTDEYSSKAACVNDCDALGLAAREEARQREELIRQGSELMQQLSEHGKRIKKEKQERLNQLEQQKIDAEHLKQEKEKLKAEAESAENIAFEKYRLIEEQEKKKAAEEERNAQLEEIFKFFSDIDDNNDEKITVDEVQAYDVFDTNKDGVVSEDEVKYFLGPADSYDWSQFHETGWPRLKPLLINYQQQIDAEYQQHKDVEKQHETDAHEEKSEDFHDQEEEDEGEVEETAEDENVEEEKSPEAPKKYDEETQRLIEIANKARSEYDEAERNTRDIDREKKQIEDSISKDYGINEEFAPLEGECYEYSDREYVYKLCPFDQVSQRPLSGGAETRLGTWAGWAGPHKYDGMRYDGGQTCWNGPARSAHINVLCGLSSQLISASEPNRCEYLLDFYTPAACHPDLAKQYESQQHDEL